MTIRTLNIEDYDAAIRLWQATPGMGLNPRDDTREGMGRFLRRNPTTCLVAEAEGAIVGVILCGHDGRRGAVYHMAVAQAWQRRGIGSALLDAAMEALEREGIAKAMLVVYADNAVGNRFWERHGFLVRPDLVYRNRMVAGDEE